MNTTAKTTRKTSAGRMMNLITRRLNEHMNARLATLGISLGDFSILMVLLENEGQTQSQLGEKTGLPAYGTTRSIDALVKLDLVERRADPTSRRSHRIFLTAKGREMGPQLFAIVTEVNDWFLGALEPAERQAFTTTLAKLV